MKIFPSLTVNNFVKVGAISAGLVITTPNIKAIPQDTFEYSTEQTCMPKDSIDFYDAPSPKVLLQGETRNATIVVDISQNILYQYDKDGEPIGKYPVASGKPSTPTKTGLRIVTNVESYPYRTASENTKRYKNPDDYGPKIIILRIIDPETGEQSTTGQFIHGTKNPSSIGNYTSHGCIRMNNDVIKELASYVKKGDLVLIKN